MGVVFNVCVSPFPKACDLYLQFFVCIFHGSLSWFLVGFLPGNAFHCRRHDSFVAPKTTRERNTWSSCWWFVQESRAADTLPCGTFLCSRHLAFCRGTDRHRRHEGSTACYHFRLLLWIDNFFCRLEFIDRVLLLRAHSCTRSYLQRILGFCAHVVFFIFLWFCYLKSVCHILNTVAEA